MLLTGLGRREQGGGAGSVGPSQAGGLLGAWRGAAGLTWHLQPQLLGDLGVVPGVDVVEDAAACQLHLEGKGGGLGRKGTAPCPAASGRLQVLAPALRPGVMSLL